MIRILCDMDGIVADLLLKLYALYNEKYDDNLTVERTTHWNISKIPGLKAPHAFTQLFRERGLFLDLEPIPGALDALNKLHALRDRDGKRVFEVFFCTSAITSPYAATEKILWTQGRLPWMPTENVICCHHKEMIKADVIIEDAPHNIITYRNAWPDAKIYAIQYPYNDSLDVRSAANLYVPSWRNTEEAWDKIFRAIVSSAKVEYGNPEILSVLSRMSL